ncbi:hypothetical protein [Flavobacterium hungaricum]|uniref:DUF4261 domain-containing protein n=1 Tax=Flavobacterium hungaricum TaxID=2082725 RepID=A0ABR9TRV9_9FLAO|nr:hypothetical protein [Flavobacterium hungaricum]MBE8728098.1 hypothetical protein [Flavobacterium hungaricum]
MGHWCSLHLFDDSKFYCEVIPVLKGETGDLTEMCLEFLKTHLVGGISRFTEVEIERMVENYVEKFILISRSFDETFKNQDEFIQKISYEERKKNISNLDAHYEFCRFFEYYLFASCADFFPHLGLGKGGVSRRFEIPSRTVAENIISELDNWNEFLAAYGMGITNWISSEDVEILYLDRENLKFEDNESAEFFLQLLEIAYNHNLGFVCGVDMNEESLELLPQNKLLSKEFWLEQKLTGVRLER